MLHLVLANNANVISSTILAVLLVLYIYYTQVSYKNPDPLELLQEAASVIICILYILLLYHCVCGYQTIKPTKHIYRE